MSYAKDFGKIFANIRTFPLINFEVTLIFVFAFREIDFILLYSFLSKSIMVLSKSIMVLIFFLFLKASSNFVLTFLVSFLCLDFLSFQEPQAHWILLYFDFLLLLFSISKRNVIFFLSKLSV